jgi:hypothetical protein
LSLQVSMSEAWIAQCSPPPSEPANNAFFWIQSERANGTFDDSGVNLDVAIIKEAA